MIGVLAVAAATFLASTTSAFSKFHAASRRALLASTAASIAAQAPIAQALDACVPTSINHCFSTASEGQLNVPEWTWPKDMKRSDAIGSLRQVIEGYPKSGQGQMDRVGGEVDAGGWTMVVDDLAGKGHAKLEYYSGAGHFAKKFNDGRPFVDDVEISVGDRGVGIRSESRMGDLDFGVNAKRISYLAKGLRDKGWNAQGVTEVEG